MNALEMTRELIVFELSTLSKSLKRLATATLLESLLYHSSELSPHDFIPWLFFLQSCSIRLNVNK